jgi:hypothetical protein
MSDEEETRELNDLHWTAMRSIFGNFIEEHPEVTALLRATTEQIRERFSDSSARCRMGETPEPLG